MLDMLFPFPSRSRDDLGCKGPICFGNNVNVGVQ